MNDEKIPLKLPEPEIDENALWKDDVLGRKKIAEALTELVRGQSASLVISLSGGWGSGKTFFLKRWQKNLANEGFISVYFNAWEDDFCDDPLVAIIGQLSETLTGKDGYKQIAKDTKEEIKSLLGQVIVNLIASKTGTNIKELLKKPTDDILENYLSQKESKQALKKSLKKMSGKIYKETEGQPLIFIIDELDRCRPLFAVELLERVKHIFEIEKIIFVFGINKGELCKSIQSIYGDIDSDVYLRRFFDIGFSLPVVKQKEFFEYLINRYGLQDFYNERGEEMFYFLSTRSGISLRDMEQCIRLVVRLANNDKRSIQKSSYVMFVLIILRLKNSDLYYRYINERCRTGEVMNYLDELLFDENLGKNENDLLNLIECYLYIADERRYPESPIEQLVKLRNAEQLTHRELLSKRTQKATPERIKDLIDKIEWMSGDDQDYPLRTMRTMRSMVSLIELFALDR